MNDIEQFRIELILHVGCTCFMLVALHLGARVVGSRPDWLPSLLYSAYFAGERIRRWLPHSSRAIALWQTFLIGLFGVALRVALAVKAHKLIVRLWPAMAVAMLRYST